MKASGSKHRPRRRTRRLHAVSGFVSALTAAVIVAACGGAASTAAPPAPTKAAFLKRANAICTNAVNARSAAMEVIATEIAESGEKTSIKSERRQLVEGAI